MKLYLVDTDWKEIYADKENQTLREFKAEDLALTLEDEKKYTIFKDVAIAQQFSKDGANNEFPATVIYEISLREGLSPGGTNSKRYVRAVSVQLNDKSYIDGWDVKGKYINVLAARLKHMHEKLPEKIELPQAPHKDILSTPGFDTAPNTINQNESDIMDVIDTELDTQNQNEEDWNKDANHKQKPVEVQQPSTQTQTVIPTENKDQTQTTTPTENKALTQTETSLTQIQTEPPPAQTLTETPPAAKDKNKKRLDMLIAPFSKLVNGLAPVAQPALMFGTIGVGVWFFASLPVITAIMIAGATTAAYMIGEYAYHKLQGNKQTSTKETTQSTQQIVDPKKDASNDALLQNTKSLTTKFDTEKTQTKVAEQQQQQQLAKDNVENLTRSRSKSPSSNLIK